ncbi:uncharacterized [Tachysurus ichikawai]
MNVCVRLLPGLIAVEFCTVAALENGHKDEDLVATCDLWSPPEPGCSARRRGGSSPSPPSFTRFALFWMVSNTLFDSTSFSLHFTRRFSGMAGEGNFTST